MARMQTGYTYQDKDGRWYCRYDYKDESGKWRTIRRRAETKGKAKETLDKLLRDFKERGQNGLDGDRMTFNNLADYYQSTYLNPPQYVDGRKVTGQRDYLNSKCLLGMLRKHFGTQKLKAITHGALERFRILRLQTPTKHEKQRSIATVNRELSLLRKILNVAKRNRWVLENPFHCGDPLIRPGDERPRERILTREEEARLLEVCIAQRAHLRPIIITAIDTGMRRGELLKLKWADVDLNSRIIRIQALNTKTMRERFVVMTERVVHELRWLYEQGHKGEEARIFGIRGSIKKAFGTARRLAGLCDIHFHDLRHTAASRLAASNIPIAEIARLLGHTQISTSFRYINASNDSLKRAAAALDAFNCFAQEKDGQTPMIH
jgi:integrase